MLKMLTSRRLDSLKQAFYKIHNAENGSSPRTFVENGGAD